MKLVNDLSLYTKAVRNELLSFSDDEVETPTPSGARPLRDNETKLNSAIEYEKASRREAFGQVVIAEDPELLVTPFLTWGVAQESSEGQKSERGLTACMRLLRNLDRDLTGNSLYLEGYRCKLKTLSARHRVLRVPEPKGHAIDPSDGLDSPSSTKPSQQIAQNHAQSAAGPGSVPPQEPQVTFVDQVAELMNEIFNISRSIMRLFIPLEAGTIGEAEWVIDRCWGALDQIFRVRCPCAPESSSDT